MVATPAARPIGRAGRMGAATRFGRVHSAAVEPTRRRPRSLSGLLLGLALAAAWPGAACVTVGESGAEPVPASAAELLDRADALFEGRRLADALESYQMAAIAASGEGDAERFVEATSQVAHLYAEQGDLESALDWFERARERAREEDPAGWARQLFARATLSRAQGDASAALREYEAAWRFADETSQPVRAVQAAHMAAVVAPLDDKLRWTRRAIEAAHALEDARLEFELWSQLAWLLEERGMASEALEAFRRARRVIAPLDDEHLRLVGDWSYGHGLRLVGRFADARAVLEDVALRAARAYASRRRPNDAEWVGHAERELAALDLAEGDRERALARLLRARAHLRLAGAEELAPRVLDEVERRIANLQEVPSAGRRAR